MAAIPRTDTAPETDAEGAALAQARALVRDLQTPRAAIYWTDFLLSTLLGWGAFVMAVRAANGSGMQVAMMIVAVLAMYRAVIFVHELAHLGPRVWPGFRLVWNALCGGPLLVQSYTYSGVHNLHHYRHLYGTKADGEYLPFARMGSFAIIGHWALALIVPVFVLIRSLILVPLSWFIPPLAKWLWETASSMTIDTAFRRQRTAHDDPSWRWQDAYTWALATVAMVLLVKGVLPWRVLLLWGVMVAGILLVNGTRTLAAHRYRSPGERPLSVMEQFHDSVDVPGWPVLTSLWAPVGLRYHATHHLFPGMPYHNLGAAYRRLRSGLSDPRWFEESSDRSLLSALRRLFREARGKAALPVE